MQYLAYPLQNGVMINRFLVSEIHAELIRGEAAAIKKEANVWEGSPAASTHINPVREAFVAKRREAEQPYPEFTRNCVGGSVVFCGAEHKLSARFPFGDPVISFSHFHPNPTWISTVAYTILESKGKKEYLCNLAVCGGVRLWVNKTLVTTFTPYNRNQSQQTQFTLPLEEGENELVIFLDEFCERDSDIAFALPLVEPDTQLIQKLPIEKGDAELVMAVEHALGDLSCKSNHVRSGNVELYCPNPYTDRDLVIELVGATEENYMVGDLHRATAVFKPHMHWASLGPCEDFPIGYLQFEATTVVEDIEVSYRLAFENFPLSLVPEPKPTMDERKMQAFEVLARYGERNGNRVVAILHAGGPQDEFEHILKRQINFINRRSDCSDFYLSYFPHILRQFSSHPYVTDELKEEMKRCLLNFRYWHDEPGDDAMWFYSENHALMFHVCQLIAGEMYPDEIFTNSGMTGIQMQVKAKRLLRKWFEVFFSIGFTEWNSPPYLPIDALGFASLYAQTRDNEMKELARKAMDYVYYILALYSLEGIFSTTAGRTYPKELFGNNSNCPSTINWIGYGIGNTTHAGKGITALCFSDYQAPQEYKQYCRVPEGKALVSQSTHGYRGYADVYTYKTSYALSSSANNFRVGERGFQENPIHLIFSATEQLWVNHPGEHNLFGHARPSYWAGNGTLPRVNQYMSFTSVVFNTNPAHPVDFTHVYLPTMEYAKFEQRGNWLFAEAHNNGYVALFCSKQPGMVTYGPNKEREFIVEGRKAVYLMRIGSKHRFGSFESFIQAMLSSHLETDDQHYVFIDPIHGELKGGWETSLTVEGQPVGYSGFDPRGVHTWTDEA